ncbi:MAG: hypothetical protein JRM90_08185, partial [Nitrososphaerota archaeon]|nr:hypothetical protein [Nitrososphaerota archaeon]
MSTTRMLETVVVKFGGSVLDDQKAVDQVASLIKETRAKGLGVVAVVSAMKGVTDQIMALSKRDNPEIAPHLLDELLSSGEKTSARLVAAALASALLCTVPVAFLADRYSRVRITLIGAVISAIFAIGVGVASSTV